MQLFEFSMMRVMYQKTGINVRLGYLRAAFLRVSTARWGWFPLISVISAFALFTLMISYNAFRGGVGSWPRILFWASLVLLYVPSTIRLCMANVKRSERVMLITLLGLSLYMVKVYHSPNYFTFGDELQHWRTVDDILHSNQLFLKNPILAVSPLYPGMEILTSAVVQLTGLDIYSAAILVIGIVHQLFLLAMFLFFELVADKPRVAGLAVLIYMTNPMFLYFSTQFAYESVSLPLAALVLLTLACRKQVETRLQRNALTAIRMLLVFSIVVTHHITADTLFVFLLLWSLVTLFRNRVKKIYPAITWTTTILLVLLVLWITTIASTTVTYLGPSIARSLSQFVDFLSGQSAGRELFKSGDGTSAPILEQLLGFSAPPIITLGLMVGLPYLWKHYRHSPAILTLGIVSLAYPPSILLRLTPGGVGLSGRISEFLFLGVGFVLAFAIAEPWLSDTQTLIQKIVSLTRLSIFSRQFVKHLVLVSALSLLFVGGVVVGWHPTDRLPGKFQVSSHGRSVERQSLEMANWMRVHLGKNNRVSTNWSNGLVLGSYGGQFTVYGTKTVRTAPIFFSHKFDDYETAIVVALDIEYLAVDYRMTTGLPVAGTYIEGSEPNWQNHTTPFNRDALEKFNAIAQIDRVFDSGDIVIFDLRALLNGQ